MLFLIQKKTAVSIKYYSWNNKHKAWLWQSGVSKSKHMASQIPS